MHNNFSVKVLLIASFPIVSAFFFGLFLKIFTGSAHLGVLLATLSFGLLLLASLIIFNILESQKITAIGCFVTSAIAMAVPFAANASIILLSGAGIAVGMLFWAHQQTRTTIQNSLKINFWRIAYQSAGYASSGIAIFGVLAYISLFNFSNPSSLKKTLEVAIRPLEPIFSQYIPGFSVRSTLTQIAAGLIPDDLKLAPPEIKSQVIQQASERLTVMLGNYVKIPVLAGDKVIDIIYHATLGKMLNYSPIVRNLILIAAGLIIFLLLKFVLIFANWLAIALAFVIFKLLYSLKFFEIQLQSIDKEVIVI